MITSAAEERIRNVFTKGGQLVIVLSDGRKHSVPLAWYPRLLNASEEQRSDWRLIGGGHGVHWPQIDEDLSVDGLLRGVPAPAAHTDTSPIAGTEWLNLLQALAEQIQKQQQYFQQMTQEVMSTYSQLFNIPISYAQEGLRDAQVPIEGYDELTVEEVSARLGSLSPEDLREVRDHEERNKNRETILKELDRRIRGAS